MRGVLGGLAMMMALFLAWTLSCRADGLGDRHLLVVMSYDSQDTWSQSLLLGLAEAMAGSSHTRHVEYLDTRHNHDEAYLALHHQMLLKKYAAYPPDLILAADDAAYRFLLEHRAHLDERLPLIFCGVNNFKKESLVGYSGVTGVNEAVDIPGTVNLGLQLFPKAKRLVAIASERGVGAINIATLRASTAHFLRPLEIVELLDLQRSEVAQLSRLAEDSLVLRLDNLRQEDGGSLSLEESMALLTAASSVPVLTCWDFDIGRGALGGRVVSGRAQGKAAGAMVRRVFAGTDPAAIPVLMDSPNETILDHAQLQRFGVDRSLLPAEAMVAGQPESLYTRYRLVIWSAVALFLVMGAGLLSLASALLARRRAEGLLRASEARYRAYVAEAPSGIFIADGNGRYLDVNPEACAITGYSREELLAMHLHELLPVEAIDEGQAHFARVKTLGAASGEGRFRRKDGEIRWWAVNAAAMPDGTFLAHVVDVSERRQDEERRAVHRQLLDNAEHIVVFKDTDLRYLGINRAFTDLTGKRLAEVIGKTDAEAFAGLSTPEQIAAYIAADRQALALPPGQRLTVEEGTLAADGSERTYLTKKFPVYSEDGRLLGVGTMTSEITEIKRAQQQLQSAIDQLGAVMDAIPADIYVMDPDSYTVLFMNKGMLRRLGEEAIGKPCWQAFGHASGPCASCRMPALLEGAPGEAMVWEEVNPATGKTFVNIDTMISWPDGRRVKLQVASDVSELRRVQAALAESEERFRAIFEHAAIGISQRYLDGSGSQVNPRFCEILGYTREELLAMSWSGLTHPEDRHASEIGMRRLLRGEIDFFTQEKRYRHRDGSTVWANLTLSLQRGADGQPLSLIACLEDVTEQRLAEAAVAASREELRQVIDLVPHFIFAKDLDGRYLLVNRTLAEAYGMTVSEMTGRLDGDIIDDRKQVERLRAVDREVLASGQLRHAEVVVNLPGEREPRYYASARVPFTVFGSDRPAVLGVSVDITEHRRDEEEKRRLTAQLHQAQKMEAIGTLAGGIAHDFNNILGAIIGYAEMLRDDSPIGTSAYNDSDQVVKAGMRAKELVKQILAFSRQSAFEKVTLQPAPIIAEALKLLRASLPTTIVIDQQLDGDCGLVLADPTHIHQIVMNICTNAFHAMEGGGGTLRVRLARHLVREEARADVGRLIPGEYLRLSIEDSGDGISPEVRERIFDPYFTTKEVGKGTGLGLATVHGIVKEYGGAVICDSVLGRGTIFHVYLPAAETAIEPVEERGEGALVGGERVLLVDDEPILVDLGRTMLERAGFRVAATTSSLEALTLFQNDPEGFDLVITDQTMPGMTGIDFARRLLQLRPGVPIILCTGYSNYLSEERARAMGIAGFAMKPLVRKEIVALIRQVLARRVIG